MSLSRIRPSFTFPVTARLAVPLANLTCVLTCALTGAAALAQGSVMTVAQLRTVASLGGTYTLGAGTFDLWEPIEVTRDLTLVGQGTGVTTIRVGAAPAGLRVGNGATVRIEGVDLTRLANDSPSLDLIQVFDGHVELVDLRLAYAKSGGEHPDKRFGLGTAVYLQGDSSAVLTDVRLDDNGLAAVEVVDGATLELRGSTLSGNAYGVFVSDHGAVLITDSVFEGSLANAIGARGRARVTVLDSQFVDNGSTQGARGYEYDAVRIGDEASLVMKRTTFRENMRYALSLFGTAQVEMTGNYFENNGGYDDTVSLYSSALLLEDRSTVTSADDRFFANTGGAIELSGTASATFVSATVERTGSHASIYSESSGTLRFVDLTAIDNEGGVAVYAGSVAFEGGTMARNGGDAIYAYGVDTLLVTGVTFLDHPTAAVAVYQVADVTLTGNTLTSNGAGIFIGPDSHAVVSDNRIEGSGTRGPAIAFHPSASGLVSGNLLRSPTGVDAIRVGDPARVALDGNDVSASD